MNYTFEYDAAGSLIEDNNYKYIYDAWNRLVEVKEPDNTLVAKYRYDALGRRINKKVLHAKDKGLLTSDHTATSSTTTATACSSTTNARCRMS